MNLERRKHPAFIHPRLVKMGLTPAEKAVYLELVFNGGEDGSSFGSVEKIRKAVGIAKNTCRNAIETLVDLGLITRVTKSKSSGGSVSKYYVLDVFEWVQAIESEKADGSNETPSGDPTDQMSSPDGSNETPSLMKINPFSIKSLLKVSGRSRKVKRDEFLPCDLIPAEWVDEEFLAAWNDWALNRPTGTLTTSAILKNTKVLAESGSRTNAILILEKSDRMGWRGLFPLNGKGSTPNQNATKFSQARPEERTGETLKDL